MEIGWLTQNVVLSCLQVVMDNPAQFTSPFRFEITFECLETLHDGKIVPNHVGLVTLLPSSVADTISLSSTGFPLIQLLLSGNCCCLVYMDE